jgi:hypothetical protein
VKSANLKLFSFILRRCCASARSGRRRLAGARPPAWSARSRSGAPGRTRRNGWSVAIRQSVQAFRSSNLLYQSFLKSRPQSTKYLYIKSTTAYAPSSELGLSQTLSRQRVCPSPRKQRGGGAHSPAGEGLGESQFRRLEKKLSTLPTLCLRVKN